MANIIISHFSSIQDNGKYQSLCFYDGIIEALKRQGHHVYQIISTGFVKAPWNGTNRLADNVDQEQLLDDLSKINPDLCIFFNNSVPETVYDIIDCPVLLFLADSVKYFNDKDVIKRKLIDKVYFFAPFQRDIHEINQIFGVGENRIINILPATGVEATTEPVDKNVSFIGTNFANPPHLVRALKEFSDRKRLRLIVEALRHDSSGADSLLSGEDIADIERHIPVAEFLFMFAPRNRIEVLASLTDLELSLFGGDDWAAIGTHFPDLAASYVPRKVYSLAHNQSIYNSSKVCLSISHTQAVDGFPWRALDVMASNGCLLTDAKPALRKICGNYVDLPTYSSAAEARDLCRKLLSDEAWRSEVVRGSQRFIEEQGRWEHRFPELGERLGVNLMTTDGTRQAGSVTVITSDAYIVQSKSRLRAFRDRLRALRRRGR